MKLAALLVEIRRRARSLPAPHIDPLQAIYERCNANPETLENKTLMRIARAIEAGREDFDDVDTWALGTDSRRKRLIPFLPSLTGCAAGQPASI